MDIMTTSSALLSGQDWPQLPNILTAEEFQNLPAAASTCIVIEGMTYAGRHTQAAAMSEELGLKRFDLSAWIGKYEPATAAELYALQNNLKIGRYLPDDLTIKIADWALNEFCNKEIGSDQFYNRPFIVVGYPRTLAQAEHFQAFLKRRQIYAIIAFIEIKYVEARRRMSQKAVDRIGHEADGKPETQVIKIGEYFLKTHGYLKWLLLTGKATPFKTCLDKGEYETHRHELSTVIDRGEYVVVSQDDVSKMIMKFLNLIHFVQHSGA
jgi:adenylate kinase family enzyme